MPCGLRLDSFPILKQSLAHVGRKTRARNRIALSELSPPETRMEKAMPVIFLWGALPVLLIGGGYVVYRVIGG